MLAAVATGAELAFKQAVEDVEKYRCSSASLSLDSNIFWAPRIKAGLVWSC